MFQYESLVKRWEESKVQNYIICHHLWIKKSMSIYAFICLYVHKISLENTQEIDNDSCLCVGVLESGGENQEQDLLFIAGLLWPSTRFSSRFTLPRHSSTAKEWRTGDEKMPDQVLPGPT